MLRTESGEGLVEKHRPRSASLAKDFRFDLVILAIDYMALGASLRRHFLRDPNRR